jgi:hypothetical protein
MIVLLGLGVVETGDAKAGRVVQIAKRIVEDVLIAVMDGVAAGRIVQIAREIAEVVP